MRRLKLYILVKIGSGLSLMRNISCIGWPSIKRLWEMKMNHISALTLIELLVKADSTWASSFKVEEKTISLEQFKQGNEKRSNTIEGGDSPTEGKLRDYEKLYKTPNTPLLRRVKQMKVVMQCRLVSRIDMNGYTLLHQAADMKYYKPTKPGPALQLQEELKWLEVS